MIGSDFHPLKKDYSAGATDKTAFDLIGIFFVILSTSLDFKLVYFIVLRSCGFVKRFGVEHWLNGLSNYRLILFLTVKTIDYIPLPYCLVY